jgi:hypothetical protein
MLCQLNVTISAGTGQFSSDSQNLLFFFIHIVWGGVQTGSTRHVGHWMTYCICPGWLWWWRIFGGMKIGRGNRSTRKKTCPSSTLSTTNPTCQTRARTRAVAVGSQWLTAWAMAQNLLLWDDRGDRNESFLLPSPLTPPSTTYTCYSLTRTSSRLNR